MTLEQHNGWATVTFGLVTLKGRDYGRCWAVLETQDQELHIDEDVRGKNELADALYRACKRAAEELEPEITQALAVLPDGEGQLTLFQETT